MTREKLENLARIGQLKAQPPNRKEFEGLLSSGKSRLQDAQREGLSLLDTQGSGGMPLGAVSI